MTSARYTTLRVVAVAGLLATCLTQVGAQPSDRSEPPAALAPDTAEARKQRELERAREEMKRAFQEDEERCYHWDWRRTGHKCVR